MSKSVLIVDDCATTRRPMRLYLKQEGYRLIQAENGLEALGKLAQGLGGSLIVTDMNMPQMDVALTRPSRISDVRRYPHPHVDD